MFYYRFRVRTCSEVRPSRLAEDVRWRCSLSLAPEKNDCELEFGVNRGLRVIGDGDSKYDMEYVVNMLLRLAWLSGLKNPSEIRVVEYSSCGAPLFHAHQMFQYN